MKTERTIIDHKTQTVQVIPSHEDSYERLLEQEVQFEGENQTEESVIRNMQLEQLYKALSLLSEDEQYLIRQLFFEERTERDLAEELKIYHNAVHKRKNRILKKLKNILENL